MPDLVLKKQSNSKGLQFVQDTTDCTKLAGAIGHRVQRRKTRTTGASAICVSALMFQVNPFILTVNNSQFIYGHLILICRCVHAMLNTLVFWYGLFCGSKRPNHRPEVNFQIYIYILQNTFAQVFTLVVVEYPRINSTCEYNWKINPSVVLALVDLAIFVWFSGKKRAKTGVRMTLEKCNELGTVYKKHYPYGHNDLCGRCEEHYMDKKRTSNQGCLFFAILLTTHSAVNTTLWKITINISMNGMRPVIISIKYFHQ